MSDLTYDQALIYLDNVVSKGFNSIYCVGGQLEPDANGQPTVIQDDISDPNDAHWNHVKKVVAAAIDRGLKVILIPLWFNLWKKKGTPKDWYHLGIYLGDLFAPYAEHIIWDTGGDDGPNNQEQLDKILNLVHGITVSIVGKETDYQLVFTHHPGQGWYPRSTMDWGKMIKWYRWLKINGCHSGHGYSGYPTDWSWRVSSLAYHVQGDIPDTPRPARPVFAVEPFYEDIARSFNPANGPADEHDVRHALYWGVFAGALAGTAYGHFSLICMKDAGNDVAQEYGWGWLKPWNDTMVLNAPGRNQVVYLRRLVESRPWITCRPLRRYRGAEPCPPVVGITENVLEDHVEYVGDIVNQKHTWVLIYIPSGHPVTVDLQFMLGSKTRASWFNVRTGEVSVIGLFNNTGQQIFTPSGIPGDRANSWVLALDSAEYDYPLPGQVIKV